MHRFWQSPCIPFAEGIQASRLVQTRTRWVNDRGRKITRILAPIEASHGSPLSWSGLSSAAPAQCTKCSWGLIPLQWSKRDSVPRCTGTHDSAHAKRTNLQTWIENVQKEKSKKRIGIHSYVMAPMGTDGLVTGAYCSKCPAVLLEAPAEHAPVFQTRAECPLAGGVIPEPWALMHREFIRQGYYDPTTRGNMLACYREPEAPPPPAYRAPTQTLLAIALAGKRPAKDLAYHHQRVGQSTSSGLTYTRQPPTMPPITFSLRKARM
jgi:hypothetical protein